VARPFRPAPLPLPASSRAIRTPSALFAIAQFLRGRYQVAADAARMAVLNLGFRSSHMLLVAPLAKLGRRDEGKSRPGAPYGARTRVSDVQAVCRLGLRAGAYHFSKPSAPSEWYTSLTMLAQLVGRTMSVHDRSGSRTGGQSAH
jgi:hypothetical protein